MHCHAILAAGTDIRAGFFCACDQLIWLGDSLDLYDESRHHLDRRAIARYGLIQERVLAARTRATK